ncbi:MAG TPA: hypothetical protein VFU04_04615 [Solirubrobacterales bacterium]|nr:hypothetical protein [Solirubrobacterales bacterium]
MTKYLKALGLAMVAAFAFSAISAAGASAQTAGHITSDGPVGLIGTEISEASGGGPNKFTAFGSNVECDSVYEGHKENSTPSKGTKELISSGETSTTITPKWTNCNGGRHIDTRSCDMEISDATTTGGVAGTYGVLGAIECNTPGDYIFVDATAGCDVRVFEQTNLSGAHLTNQGGGHMRLHGTITGIHATTSCFDLTTTSASLHLDVTIKGTNAEGGATAVSISD